MQAAAQLTLLRRPETSLPFFWGSFHLIEGPERRGRVEASDWLNRISRDGLKRP